MESYKHNKTTVHHQDCMELMLKTPDNYYDWIITDPPFGSKSDAIDIKNTKNKTKYYAKRKDYYQYDNVQPPKEYFDEIQRISKNQIIFGVNHFPNMGLLSGGRLCWDKKQSVFGRGELAYVSSTNSVDVREHLWSGFLQKDMKNKEIRHHNSQKPVGLYEYILINYCKEGDKIFDGYIGSWSVAIACHNLNFEFTGCEITEHYFKEGIKRFNNHISQTKLF